MIPPSASGFSPLPQRIGQPTGHLGQALGVGIDRIEGLRHQAQEVGPQPGHAGELGPVGDLVQGQPQPELTGREGELLLEGEHVGTDVVHEVLVERGLVLDDEQVVLAQHPGGHPAQHHAHLGPGDLLGHRRQGVGVEALAELVDQRAQQALERGHVGPHPPRSVGDPGPGRAGQRHQPGLVGHQALGQRGQLGEVGLERFGVVRLAERLAPGHAHRHPLRRGPIDGAGHGQSLGYRGATTLRMYCTPVAMMAMVIGNTRTTAIQKCQTWAARTMVLILGGAASPPAVGAPPGAQEPARPSSADSSIWATASRSESGT